MPAKPTCLAAVRSSGVIAALLAAGCLWFGEEEPAGAPGLGAAAEPVPVPAPVGSQVRFQAVATGAFHAIAVAADGAVYLFGSNQFYASGFGLEEPRFEPTLRATFCPAL